MSHREPHLEDKVCECECDDCVYFENEGFVEYMMCKCPDCDKEACGLHGRDGLL